MSREEEARMEAGEEIEYDLNPGGGWTPPVAFEDLLFSQQIQSDDSGDDISMGAWEIERAERREAFLLGQGGGVGALGPGAKGTGQQVVGQEVGDRDDPDLDHSDDSEASYASARTPPLRLRPRPKPRPKPRTPPPPPHRSRDVDVDPVPAPGEIPSRAEQPSVPTSHARPREERGGGRGGGGEGTDQSIQSGKRFRSNREVQRPPVKMESLSIPPDEENEHKHGDDGFEFDMLGFGGASSRPLPDVQQVLSHPDVAGLNKRQLDFAQIAARQAVEMWRDAHQENEQWESRTKTPQRVRMSARSAHAEIIPRRGGVGGGRGESGVSAGGWRATGRGATAMEQEYTAALQKISTAIANGWETSFAIQDMVVFLNPSAIGETSTQKEDFLNIEASLYGRLGGFHLPLLSVPVLPGIGRRKMMWGVLVLLSKFPGQQEPLREPASAAPSSSSSSSSAPPPDIRNPISREFVFQSTRRVSPHARPMDRSSGSQGMLSSIADDHIHSILRDPRVEAGRRMTFTGLTPDHAFSLRGGTLSTQHGADPGLVLIIGQELSGALPAGQFRSLTLRHVLNIFADIDRAVVAGFSSPGFGSRVYAFGVGRRRTGRVGGSQAQDLLHTTAVGPWIAVRRGGGGMEKVLDASLGVAADSPERSSRRRVRVADLLEEASGMMTDSSLEPASSSPSPSSAFTVVARATRSSGDPPALIAWTFPSDSALSERAVQIVSTSIAKQLQLLDFGFRVGRTAVLDRAPASRAAPARARVCTFDATSVARLPRIVRKLRAQTPQMTASDAATLGNRVAVLVMQFCYTWQSMSSVLQQEAAAGALAVNSGPKRVWVAAPDALRQMLDHLQFTQSGAASSSSASPSQHSLDTDDADHTVRIGAQGADDLTAHFPLGEDPATSRAWSIILGTPAIVSILARSMHFGELLLSFSPASILSAHDAWIHARFRGEFQLRPGENMNRAVSGIVLVGCFLLKQLLTRRA